MPEYTPAMPGGMTQIAAVGTADQYLVGNPQVTMWKQVWRRYTNFALESIVQSWTGDCDFGKKCTVVLARSGDLVSDCWLEINLPSLANLNHIPTPQRLSTAPAITFARSTTQSNLTVRAYGCNANNYVCSLRSANSPVTSVAWSDTTGLSLTLATNNFVSLHDLSGNTTAITASVSSSVATVSYSALAAGIANGITYGVQVGSGSTVWTNHVVQVRAGGLGVDPVFAMANVNPSVPAYYATVVTQVANTTTRSGEEIVMKAKWCNEVGHALISAVEWEMGGSRIDRHNPQHWSMWNEVSENAEKRDGYSDMVGRYDAYDINYDATSFGADSKLLYVPLRFTFNQSPGSALPLVALQFHDCRLNFEFADVYSLLVTNVPRLNVQTLPTLDASVYSTYAFLSQEERSRFAQMPHEYLIEQLQPQVETISAASSPNGTLTRKFTLTFTHPVKEIMWAFQATSSLTANDYFNYDVPHYEDQDIFGSAKIQMNGHDRFAERPARYFRLVQPWTYHTRVPTKKVYVYSFALHPEAWNPSGAANYSRIDTSQLYLNNLNPNIPIGTLRIHAISYNVLRIANGLSGVVFA